MAGSDVEVRLVPTSELSEPEIPGPEGIPRPRTASDGPELPLARRPDEDKDEGEPFGTRATSPPSLEWSAALDSQHAVRIFLRRTLPLRLGSPVRPLRIVLRVTVSASPREEFRHGGTRRQNGAGVGRQLGHRPGHRGTARPRGRQRRHQLPGREGGGRGERGYYDEGSPLGASQNDECKIDSIAQSWAVLSGAVPLRFADRATDAVRTHLSRRAHQVVLLLAPPFDQSPQSNPATSRDTLRGAGKMYRGRPRQT